MNKYGNRKVVIDGIEFMSQKEGNRYCELKLMQKAKMISNLQLQPKFMLQEGFKKNGKKYQAITYIADFMYFDNIEKRTIVEDVKSEATKTDVYKIKKKLFEYKYKELTINEVE